MAPTRIALLISLLAIAAQRITAQQALDFAPTAVSQPPATPAEDSNQPVATLHVTLREVVLDVVVTDVDGRPVKGLKPSNFALTEDGVPQSLVGFKEYSGSDDAATSATQNLPPNTFTVSAPIPEDTAKTIIVIGSLSPAQQFVLSDLRAFLKTVPPGSPIAIFHPDGQGLHLVRGFTTDPRLLEGASDFKRILQPIGFRMPYARMAGNTTRNLARLVTATPGRINLVWLFDTSLRGSDIVSFLNDLNVSSDVLRLSRVALYPINASGFRGYLPNLEDAVKAAGGRMFREGIKQSLTQIVGAGSDYYTLSYLPTNQDWNGAWRKIKIETSGLPEVESTQTLWDRFLGWTDDEAKVEYRQGYFARSDSSSSARPAAPPPSSRQLISISPKAAPLDTRMLNAMDLGTLPPDQVDFTIAVTPSSNAGKLKPGAPLPAANYLTPLFRDIQHRNYQIQYRINPRSLQFSRATDGSYRDDLQFVTVCYRDDGLVVGRSAETTLHINASEADFQEMLTSGLSFNATLAVPDAGQPFPGNSFFVRAGVHEIPTDRIGALEISTEWIKLPSEQTAGNNVAANHAPSSTPPPVVNVESVNQQPTPNVAGIDKLLPPPTEFDVAVIRPSNPDEPGFWINIEGNTVNIQYATLLTLINKSFNIAPGKIENKPKWLDDQHYDILGKAATGDASPIPGLGPSVDIDDVWKMTRSLLANRFKLTTHTELRSSDVYALLTANPKMKKADPENYPTCYEGPGPDGKDPRLANPARNRLISCQNMTMSQFTTELSSLASGYLPSPVIDTTSLDGAYDFTLSFSKQIDLNKPGAISLFDAMQKQLGLKLEKRDKVPMPVLVIDHIEEQPTDD